LLAAGLFSTAVFFTLAFFIHSFMKRSDGD
jgi:hypothetical protein